MEAPWPAALRHVPSCTFNASSSQALRTQWFVITFAIPLDKCNTFRADQRSGTTNTVVLARVGFQTRITPMQTCRSLLIKQHENGQV